jgi:hypothetical protein
VNERWYYTYVCSPSVETRGRRKDHDKGCGWTCTRSTRQEITDNYKPQGAPCPNCSKKQRLNAGMVKWWALRQDMEYHANQQNLRFSQDAPHSRSEDKVSIYAEEMVRKEALQ